MIKFLKMLLVRDRKSQIGKYLASSSDLVELERRQQELARKGFGYENFRFLSNYFLNRLCTWVC